MSAAPSPAVQRGLLAHQQGRLEEAAKHYDAALRAAPHDALALQLAGVVAMQRGDPARGASLIERAIAAGGDDAGAWANLAVCHARQDRHEQALAAADAALARNPELAEAHGNRGNALLKLGRAAAALEALDQALVLRPDSFEALSNRGMVLAELDRAAEALATLDRAIALKPDHAEAHLNRGQVLRTLGRPQEGLAALHEALRLRPEYWEALQALATLHMREGRAAEALPAIDKAITLKPELGELHQVRGDILGMLNRIPEAVGALRRALMLDPTRGFLPARIAHNNNRMCRWDDWQADLAAARAGIEAGRDGGAALDLLGLFGDRALLRRGIAQHTVAATLKPGAAAEFAAPAPRIRLGYVSADLRNHALAVLMAGVFEQHDRTRFETFAFSLRTAAPQDPMRPRLQRAFDRHFDVTQRSDAEVAEMMRGMGIDIAVDLTGFTEGGRPGIFARRAAPVQVGYLGFPATMAVPWMDYIIGDAVVVPPDRADGCSEAVLRLPHCFQAGDSTRLPEGAPPSRDALGLPGDATVFCCFNNTWKLNPPLFDSWMRILHRVPGSVLWLLEDTRWVPGNLRREAGQRGIDPARLVFARRMAGPGYLARYGAADLFLDTLPYNGGATASDVLRAGLPLLTQAGDAFPGRMAASLLSSLGLHDLVTDSAGEYEARAVELAQDPARLAGLRARLVAARGQATLFDTARFTRHLEAGFVAMHERRLAGLPPAPIDVPA